MWTLTISDLSPENRLLTKPPSTHAYFVKGILIVERDRVYASRILSPSVASTCNVGVNEDEIAICLGTQSMVAYCRLS